MVEMARIRLHGFSEREVNQARASMMSDVESAYIERHQDYSQVGSPTLSNAPKPVCSGNWAEATFGSQQQTVVSSQLPKRTSMC